MRRAWYAVSIVQRDECSHLELHTSIRDQSMEEDMRLDGCI